MPVAYRAGAIIVRGGMAPARKDSELLFKEQASKKEDNQKAITFHFELADTHVRQMESRPRLHPAAVALSRAEDS